jgi:hypothetical protein
MPATATATKAVLQPFMPSLNSWMMSNCAKRGGSSSGSSNEAGAGVTEKLAHGHTAQLRLVSFAQWQALPAMPGTADGVRLLRAACTCRLATSSLNTPAAPRPLRITAHLMLCELVRPRKLPL